MDLKNKFTQDAGDFAMVAYFVLKNRCPEKEGSYNSVIKYVDIQKFLPCGKHICKYIFVFCSLTIKQVNDLLDKVAMGNVEHKKADTRNALQVLLRNTSALEQGK